MGDFLLDFRERDRRSLQAQSLRFYPDMVLDRIERDAFTLVVSRTGSDQLWAPYESRQGVVVALAGRVALDASQWQSAADVPGQGGLACKAIYAAYSNGGIAAIGRLAGNCAIHVFDPRTNAYYLLADRAGTLPCYVSKASDEVLGSHPDILADRVGGDAAAPERWDLTSMAQFVATGVVSFPHSYYRDIEALEFGCAHRFALQPPLAPRRSVERFANWQVEALSSAREDDLADRLAAAIADAARTWTLPVLGRTAVALSGGLDSRTILCAASKHDQLLAFCAFDHANAEFRTAKAIADAVGVELVPFERPFDHYADHAEMGVRISGGMGEIASNHFLGFRQRLRDAGVENLVTGCYFDYMFKSLALDSREAGLLRRERFQDFAYETYLPHFPVPPTFHERVQSRLEALFPAADRLAATPEARARNAMRRIFPLYHEGDNCQRLVPQRVMGWSPPAVDPAVLELCRSTPPELKLDKRLFRKAVRRVCGPLICAIPDNNTGLPVTAGALRLGLSRYLVAARRRIERRRKQMATRESWPNWPYYVRSSAKLRALWQRPNPVARRLLTEVCGESFRDDVASYCDRPTQYFMRLLTLKLWVDCRTGA